MCTQYLPTQFLTSEVHVVGFNMFVGLKLMCILIYFQPIAKGARYIMWYSMTSETRISHFIFKCVGVYCGPHNKLPRRKSPNTSPGISP